jgi:hypothetical protein
VLSSVNATARQQTSRTSGDHIPGTGPFRFLPEEDKIKIFRENENPARAIPALGKIR